MTRHGPTAAVAPRTYARRSATTALLAALLAGSTLLAVPLQPVPVTMQVFIVVLIALLVEPALAALAVGTYLLIGAVGLPVFAGFHAGISSFVGPTGGFLIGFLAGAVAGSWVRVTMERRGTTQLVADITAAAVVIALIYVFGWVQLMLVVNLTPPQAFLAGVAPFIVIDVLKAVAAVSVAESVRKTARI